MQYICTVHVMCIIVILCNRASGDGHYIWMIALLEVYYPNIPPILALSDLTFMYGVRDVTVTIPHIWTSFAVRVILFLPSVPGP